jgi:hypothetical protein
MDCDIILSTEYDILDIIQSKTRIVGTLDEHFEYTLGDVRRQLESGQLSDLEFECVTKDGTFDVTIEDGLLNDPKNRVAVSALRDCFRRRRVSRYVVTGRALMINPPERAEWAHVIAVERNGVWKYAYAEITRDGGAVTVGPWKLSEYPRMGNGSDDRPTEAWLLDLLEQSDSDKASKLEVPWVRKLPKVKLSQHKEIFLQLERLIIDLLENEDESEAIFLAIETVLRSIVKEMGSPTRARKFVSVLREYPDKFPMFATEPFRVSSAHHADVYTALLRDFSSEQRERGHRLRAIFRAFMHVYMFMGSQVIGGLNLADRIGKWSREAPGQSDGGQTLH